MSEQCLFGAPIPAIQVTEDVGRVPPISIKGSAAPGYLSPAVAGGLSNHCA
jgi:hypothetical protein